MSFLSTVSICAALAASALPSERAYAAGGKEAVGFDEELPEEEREPGKEAPAMVEPGPEGREPGEEPLPPDEPPPPPERRPVVEIPREKPRRVPSGPVQGLRFSVEAGGLFPVKGRATEHGTTLAVGARALFAPRGSGRAALALAFDYANPRSDRGASQIFLVDAGLRLRLVGEDVSTCPLYAGVGLGFAAESVTDDYEGGLPGNMGLTVRIGLGVRLSSRLGLGLGYVIFPDSENVPGVGLASLGYSF